MIALRITALLALLLFGLAAHGAPITTSQHLSAPLVHLAARTAHEYLPLHPSVSTPQGEFTSEEEPTGKKDKVRVVHKNKAGELVGADEHTLDDQGRIIETKEHRSHTGADGTVKTNRHMKHTHDDQGRLEFTKATDSEASTTYQYEGNERKPRKKIHLDHKGNLASGGGR